jgi:hypothetical protein
MVECLHAGADAGAGVLTSRSFSIRDVQDPDGG